VISALRKLIFRAAEKASNAEEAHAVAELMSQYNAATREDQVHP